MLAPRNPRARSCQRGHYGGVRGNTTRLAWGDYGLVATTGGRVSARTLEAVRRVFRRRFRRAGRLWIRVFPDTPVTRKPLESRMGKGKGTVDHWEARVAAGHVLYEMDGVAPELAAAAARTAGMKLPVGVRLVARD